MTSWAGVHVDLDTVRGGGGGYMMSMAAENTLLLSTAQPPRDSPGRTTAGRGGACL